MSDLKIHSVQELYDKGFRELQVVHAGEAEAMQERIAELARKPVCVGYVNRWHMQQLTQGIKDDGYPVVRPDKDDVYFIPVYIDPLGHEIAQEDV